MKNNRRAIIFTVASFCCRISVAATSPTYTALESAMGVGKTSGAIFDGAVTGRNCIPEEWFWTPDLDLRRAQGVYVPTQQLLSPPLPPVAVRVIIEYTMEDNWQWGLVYNGVKTFAGTVSGRPVADFFNNQDMEIIWSNRGFAGKTPYAYTLPPTGNDSRKIYLNVYYGNLLMSADDPNFTFLSSIIAHETVHQQDYESLQLKQHPYNNSVELLLELHAISTEVYVYEQLRYSKKVPPIEKETRDLQLIRLYADIFNYVNGGKRPKEDDFPQLKRTLGMPFGDYVDKVSDPKKRGLRSLLGVVIDLNGFDDFLENPPQPNAYENTAQTGKYLELIQYNALMKNIDNSYRAFEAWKKSVTPVPPSTPVPAQQPNTQNQTPYHPPHNGSGGSGGNNHNGSNGSSQGGGTTPSVHPPNWGGGTGLDNPGAATLLKQKAAGLIKE